MPTPIDLDKLRTVGVISRRSGPVVRTGTHPETGERCRTTRDELGNTVTETAERQDVTIRAPHIQVALGQKEVRHDTSG